MDISKLTIKEARRALDAKEFSSTDLTDAYLDSIAKKDTEIHAYLEVWAERAREEAKIADERIERGESAPLTGIPLAIKDNILIEGRIASAASKMLENYRASYDASVTKKLKDQGAVFLGRTNMDEFALGASTEYSAFGPTRNPHDVTRVPGGTSGGSAAAIAADMALGALGSDTGGSIRQPSALCGVVGLKPTYGAVSRYGLIAAASSLDQIGPLTKTVEDAEILFRAIGGHDRRDSTSLPDIERDTKKPRVIGVPRAIIEKGLADDVRERFERTLTSLKDAQYELRTIELPNFDYALPVYYIINPAEVSANLARFDGIRYGLSVPADDIAAVYEKTRSAGFGPEVRRRILIGTYVLSAGYADAYYRKAREVRALIRADFTRAFDTVDAIVTPTTASPAFEFNTKSDPVSMYLEDLFTVPCNLAGVPAISVPSGTVVRPSTSLSFESEPEGPSLRVEDGTGDSVRLPVGFQIIAPQGCEETLFALGKDVEKAQ